MDKGIKRVLLILLAIITTLISLNILLTKFISDPSIGEMKRLKKEQVQLLRPEFREKFLRYIEKNDRDSLLYLRTQIGNINADQNTLRKIQTDINRVDSLIKSNDFKTALELIITVKGQIEKINMFAVDHLKKQLDSLRVELYKRSKTYKSN